MARSAGVVRIPALHPHLDIFWLKDESLEDSENLPPPEVIAQEMIEDLEAALEQLRLIAGDLGKDAEVES